MMFKNFNFLCLKFQVFPWVVSRLMHTLVSAIQPFYEIFSHLIKQQIPGCHTFDPKVVFCLSEKAKTECIAGEGE